MRPASLLAVAMSWVQHHLEHRGAKPHTCDCACRSLLDRGCELARSRDELGVTPPRAHRALKKATFARIIVGLSQSDSHSSSRSKTSPPTVPHSA